MPVSRKTEVASIDGTPDKRMFWSIISDYDLPTGLCELVDNALDLWVEAGRNKPLAVTVDLDVFAASSRSRISYGTSSSPPARGTPTRVPMLSGKATRRSPGYSTAST